MATLALEPDVKRTDHGPGFYPRGCGKSTHPCPAIAVMLRSMGAAKRLRPEGRSRRVSAHFRQAALAACLFLRQHAKPRAPRADAKSGKAAGIGTAPTLS